MSKPTTILDALRHIAEHYGLTMAEAQELIRTPTAPRDLRDEFAAKALVGAIAQIDVYNGREHSSLAYVSYQIADAMLAERAKAPR